MSRKSRQITLTARPEGMPKESDFKLETVDLGEPAPGQVLVRTNYLSVDPYMRGLIGESGSYAEPVPLGGVMIGRCVGAVVASQSAKYAEGDAVFGEWGWREYALCDESKIEAIDLAFGAMPLWLSVLGMPGMTAYFGLLEVARPKSGDSVFVSAAAGAVGSLVGQIAKIKGCYVAGSAGSRDKVRCLYDLGFDSAFNYKESEEYGAVLREVCPNGIDVYFDNVGGKLTDAVFPQLNVGARVAVCGQISQYNSTRLERGPRLLWHLIVKQARAEGFLVFQFADRYPEARRELAGWIKAGRISHRETVADGIENAPKAFIGLFRGDNTGKQLVRVAAEQGGRLR